MAWAIRKREGVIVEQRPKLRQIIGVENKHIQDARGHQHRCC